MNQSRDYEELRGLIAGDELERALEMLQAKLHGRDRGLENEILMQKARLANLRRVARAGTMAQDDILRQSNQIRAALLDLVEEAEAQFNDDDAVVQEQAFKAFISYRREGGAEIARLLRAELGRRKQRAFLDVEDLGPGRFGDELRSYIDQAPTFIVILSSAALARVGDKADWFRWEITHAINTRKHIVPVTMPNFSFPTKGELPVEIDSLRDLQAVSYSHQFFDATMDKISEYLV